MLSELIHLLSSIAASLSASVAVGGAVVGLCFWLVGARFSQSLVTLLAVALGTSLGMRLPRWLGWGIDGMAVAVGGALLLGLLGYLLHRTWVGLGLGILLSGWGIAGSCLALLQSQPFPSPAHWWQGDLVDSAQAIWRGMPGELAHRMGISLAGGMIIGIMGTIFLPRASRAMAWSLAGATMMLTAAALAWPAALSHWPPVNLLSLSDRSQVGVLTGFVLLGALIQYGLCRGARPAATTSAISLAAKQKPENERIDS